MGYEFCESDMINIISYRDIERKFVGEITAIESPSNFYVNIVKGDEWNSFVDLCDDMQYFYKKNQSKCYLGRTVAVGQLVAVKIDDKHWERGCIRKIISKTKFDVFMIDTGYSHLDVHEKDIRLLRYKYANHSRAQAIPVKLAFIEPTMGHWVKESRSIMKRFMDMELLIKCVSTELTKDCNRFPIMVHENFDDKLCVITPRLLKEGLAQFAEESIINKINEDRPM